MLTKKIFPALFILNLMLITLGAGYSEAGILHAGPTSQVVSAQGRLSSEIVISELDNTQYRPDIAYNPNHDEYLVVWENVWPGGSHDIYAQRISSDGHLLSWFAVFTGTNNQMQPSVAYDPTRDRYLVTWIYDTVGDGSNWDVVGRLIPWDGPDASLTDFFICTWSTSQWHPKVVYALAQDEFLVVWMTTPSGTPTYISGQRIFGDGTVLPANPFPISNAAEASDFPAVAYNLARNEYLVTWDVANASLDINGTRLNGTGSHIGGGEFTIAGWPADEEHPSVAACNLADQYLVTWQSLVDPPTDYAIYAEYLNGDGILVGVHLVDDTTSPQKESDVTCSQGGNKYLIAWQNMYSDGYYGIAARQAYPDQAMDPSFGLIASGDEADRTYPAVAGGKVSYLVAWEHERDGSIYQDIHGMMLTPHEIFLPTLFK
jgi:hypothetical protein